jgi:thiamine transport system ATP-binding protein
MTAPSCDREHGLELDRISVAHDGRSLIRDLSFSVERGSTTALLGPSGVGKSSLLRVIAGIDRPAGGRILLDGSDVTDTPIHQRRIGLVFQDNQLFPHLSVADNVAYGLRNAATREARRSWRGSRTRERVHELLSLVGLADRENDPVGVLSGGEAKRVALARGLAPTPKALLLDEPLTGLDRALHDRLMEDLATILRTTGTTALIVTHDESEARFLSSATVRLG